MWGLKIRFVLVSPLFDRFAYLVKEIKVNYILEGRVYDSFWVSFFLVS